MNDTDALERAFEEARRFLWKAEAALNALQDDPMKRFGSKETAAARRSSMDLTRALAEYRGGKR